MRSLVTCRTHRLAHFSTSADLSKKYPFPRYATNPTPHEIFHLSPEADQAAVKRRYFELVRVYHPDAATARGVPVQVAERQFKSITAAYTRLRHPSQTHGHRDMEYHQEIQRRRNLHRGVGVRDFEFRRNAAQAEAKATTLWQRDEGLIFIFSLLAFFAALYQLASPNPSQVAQQRHKESQKYLSEARSRGKEEGMRRREEIKTWLRDRRDNQAKPSESNGDPSPSQSNPGNIAGFGDAVPLRYSDREFTVSEHDQR